MVLGACADEDGGGGIDPTPTPDPGLACGTGTHESDGTCVADPVEQPTPPLLPGSFTSPIVQLQRAQGKEGEHLHIDEVRFRKSDKLLFYCSYTFGVLDASNPDSMKFLAESLKHTVPGQTKQPGCIHLAFDSVNPDIVYTTHRGNIDNPVLLSGWDLKSTPNADPTKPPTKLAPVQLPVLQEPGMSYEGIDAANGHIYVGLKANGLGIYDRPAGGTFTRIGTATGAGLEDAWGIRVRGNIAYVANGLAGLTTVDVTDPANPTVLGHVFTGGMARDVVVDGNFAYVAAGPVGLVTVDISTPSALAVVSTVDMRGSALRVAFGAQMVYVAAWNDARAYDVRNPAAPRFIGAVRLTRDLSVLDPAYQTTEGGDYTTSDDRPAVTARTLGIAANDEIMFVGNWFVPYSFRVHRDRVAPSILLPEEMNLIDMGPVVAGARITSSLDVTNQGTAPLTIVNAFTDDAAFTVRPSQARIAPNESATFEVTHLSTTADKATSLLTLMSDDPDQPIRKGFLVANQKGLGVGKLLPETRVALVDGSDEFSSSQATGSVMLLAYFATF